jgi:ligand-binding sensor domain-containing protein/signal transduction histidine kinase
MDISLTLPVCSIPSRLKKYPDVNALKQTTRRRVRKTTIWKTAILGLWLLSSAAVCVALDPHQGLRHYGYQSWQTDSGLPQNTVHAVLQTGDGYLWIGTEAGLVRFDSTQFKTFTRKDTPQLGSDLIYSLMEDRSGALWIGTSSGITRYRNHTFDSFVQSDISVNGAVESAVWSIHQDRSGNIWIITAGGVAFFDGKRFVSVAGLSALNEDSVMLNGPDGSLWLGTIEGLRYAPAGSRNFQPVGPTLAVQALAIDGKGRAWAGTAKGVEICSETACTPLRMSEEPSNTAETSIRALAFDAKGTAWIGTDAGLLSYEGRQFSRWSVADGLPSNRVNLLLCDREGAVWVGTAGGIARLFADKFEAFTPKAGFSSNLVLALYEDREGSLWLGTESGGLDILRDRKFTTYTAEDGISDDHIRTVYQDRAGTVWLGTSGGGLDREDKNGFTTLTTTDGLSSNIVLSIASAPNGDLWLGTPDGLDRIHDHKVSVFTSADGLADDFVRSIYFDDQGTAWIGTRRGLSQWKDGGFTTYTALDGLGSDLVGAILQSPDGSLWISTLGGLTHWSHGVFHNYTEKDGLSNRIVTALYADADGTLWIGTDGGGLNRMRAGKIQAVTPRNAELPANIYGILEDAGGSLWLSSSTGIVRIDRQALNRSMNRDSSAVSVEAYGVADGMKISEASSGGHPAAWRLRDGTLWFATLKGVSTVDPAHLAINRVPPLVSIEQISVDDEPHIDSATVTISPGRRRVALEYAALSFVAPQKVRFQYKLEGFDRNWVDAGSRRTAYYTNLPPGRYIFQVKACNNDGVWSQQPASLTLRLQPFFYQTIWFYLVLALSLALLGYGIYLWRLRQIESRFQVVLTERNRIAREIHDTLAQGFVAVSVQLQVASRLLANAPVIAQQHLAQAQELVRTGLEDARRAIWELRSQGAEESDFASKLVKMANRLTEAKPIETKVRVYGTYRPLPAQTENELLRIAQEAVTNAIRHAEPTHIEIQLRFAEKNIQLLIEDDGCGFTGAAPSVREGHYGLTGMKERAKEIGGSLTVSSQEGQGTRIQVEVSSKHDTNERQ